jgi:hypothetical protein
VKSINFKGLLCVIGPALHPSFATLGSNYFPFYVFSEFEITFDRVLNNWQIFYKMQPFEKFKLSIFIESVPN